MINKIRARRTLKKQKYNIIVYSLILIVGFLLVSFVVHLINIKKISKYDNKIVILKDNGSEIESISLKELRTNNSQIVDLPLINQDKKTTVEGISLEKIINNLRLDPTKYNKLETTNRNGQRNSITIDKALEPDRVYLIFKINSQALFDYNKQLGYFAIIDKESNTSSDWLKDVKEINLK